MEDLIIFLRKHKVLTTFKNNFKKRYLNTRTLEDFCIKRSQEDYFEAAFIWADTKQGHRFWDNLDIEWRKSL